jgi:NAD(P)-dependent dehydrogenase (short-subunit alcohol dehydrogenase family)
MVLVPKSNLLEGSMPDNRVARLAGAGDAIGAAVARRFARGGYKVCVARREAAKSQGLRDEAGVSGLDIRAFSVDARQEAEVQGLFCPRRSRGRSGRGLSVQCRLQRQQAAVGDH